MEGGVICNTQIDTVILRYSLIPRSEGSLGMEILENRLRVTKGTKLKTAVYVVGLLSQSDCATQIQNLWRYKNVALYSPDPPFLSEG